MITPRYYSRPRRQLEVQHAYESGRIVERVIMGCTGLLVAVGIASVVAGAIFHVIVHVGQLFPH